MWFDSHCHLDFDVFAGTRTQVWEAARARGVLEAFVPGVAPEQWERLRALPQQLRGVYTGIGVHPAYISAWAGVSSQAALRRLLRERALEQRAVAIGEFGWDARVAKAGGASLAAQAEVARQHLAVAEELQLPVVLHVVGAHGPALETLRQNGPITAGGVVHGFSGSKEVAREYARLGLKLGLGTGLLRPSARRVLEAAQALDDTSLLLETDAPDQPIYGTAPPNRPEALLRVAQRLAELRALPLSSLAKLTTDNARELFVRAR